MAQAREAEAVKAPARKVTEAAEAVIRQRPTKRQLPASAADGAALVAAASVEAVTAQVALAKAAQFIASRSCVQ